MRQEDRDLIVPGIRVLIGPNLKGAELYGCDDPESLKYWCGREVTVAKIYPSRDWTFGIEEDSLATFFIEEVERIIDDAEIEESNESIDVLFGGVT